MLVRIHSMSQLLDCCGSKMGSNMMLSDANVLTMLHLLSFNQVSFQKVLKVLNGMETMELLKEVHQIKYEIV